MPTPLHTPIRHTFPLQEGETFELDEDAMRQIAFRAINIKEAFTIVDAQGNFFRASLKAIRSGVGEAVAYEKMRGSPESPAKITLVCAVLARQRMILVTQKATELGCVRVAPVFSEKSVQPSGIDHEKPWAWPAQALKGARQCRRASVPEVLKVQPLASALESSFWREANARFMLDDRAPGEGDPFPPPERAPEPVEVVLAIGPEGGWSDAERRLLQARGAIALALGVRVLRAETAVFAGLTVLQHRFGDLRP
jgi:16S rRNA (uracil1498-N3)-methyltransferase